MSKVSGTYPSLSRGVNQQPFEARLDGQHGEQVNMWSDPVHGLSRRRGTTLQSCYTDNVTGPSYHQLPEYQKRELRDFYASYRTVPYVTDGVELQVHYPTKPQPTWMQSPLSGGSGGIRVTRKIQGSGPLQPGADCPNRRSVNAPSRGPRDRSTDETQRPGRRADQALEFASDTVRMPRSGWRQGVRV